MYWNSIDYTVNKVSIVPNIARRTDCHGLSHEVHRIQISVLECPGIITASAAVAGVPGVFAGAQDCTHLYSLFLLLSPWDGFRCPPEIGIKLKSGDFNKYESPENK